MILLWVTLLVLHQGHTLVPVTTVELGEPVNLTCALPDTEPSRRKICWYRQRAGETLKLIVTLWLRNQPVYAPEFPNTTLVVNNEETSCNLTIHMTVEQDEGMYHCAIVDWMMDPQWSGVYLLVKGNTQRTSDYIVDQSLTISGPDYPEDLMTLQCSILSDSENKMCSGDHSVFWFRAGPHRSHPDVIFSDGKRRVDCERRSDTQRSCVYRYLRSFSSHEVGMYYCAVATCGEIFFGDITKLEIGIDSGASQTRNDNLSQLVHATEGGADLNYTALHFSGNKATRGRKKKELKTEESVYSQVKC
ncbi:uncharacterized protein LOC121948351 isoform X2 [Plectropomus leopardus]|uniref:uncharacterized protein LOC121948351 isoform X2 n=1 Tax=Plectropomus leopardus TaxID=160734 RepID=UPI001C4CC7F7|nr:uncharacterized protein LOC121948351 isoform X2 [Plectropomus leopardus]